MSSVMRFDTWQDSNGVARNAIIGFDSVTKTDTFSASVSGGGSVAVTGLSLTYEVENPANKLIITAVFGVAASGDGRAPIGLAVNDGTSFIGVGDSAGSRISVSSGGRIAGTIDGKNVSMPMTTFEHIPGSGSKTYTVHIFSLDGSATETLYVNRNATDGDVIDSPRGISTLMIQEVAV